MKGKITKRLRGLCSLLIENVSEHDLSYVESVLGMNYSEALMNDEKVLVLFLLLLEAFVKYVQQLVMLEGVAQLSRNLEVTSVVLDFGELRINVDELVKASNVRKVVNLYNKLFLSRDGQEVLRFLISGVRNPDLQARFSRFFLEGASHEH